jgi:hypothetical protein
MVWEFDIENAFLLTERKVARPMQRKSEDSRIAREYCGGPVALMHVAVDDSGALDTLRFARPLYRHCQVVEDAESRSLRSKGVVRAARKRSSDAVGQSRLRRSQSSTRAAQRSFDKFYGPRESNAPHEWTVKSALQKAVNVRRVVNAKQVSFFNKGRWLDAKPFVGRKRLTQQPVFWQGKLVAGWKRKRVVICIEEVYCGGQVLG